MKFVAILLMAGVLSSCAHDEEMAAVFGLVLGAALVDAAIDDDGRRQHGYGHGRHDHERRGGDRGNDEHGRHRNH